MNNIEYNDNNNDIECENMWKELMSALMICDVWKWMNDYCAELQSMMSEFDNHIWCM